MMPLREWLLDAGIPADKLDAMLVLLNEHWVTDVPTLVLCRAALEKHLPAAAFVAISQALDRAPPSEPKPALVSTLPAPPEAENLSQESRGFSTPQQLLLLGRQREEEAVRSRQAFEQEVRRMREALRRARTWSVDPGSAWMGIWDAFVLLGCLFTAVVVPFEVGFLVLTDDVLWRMHRAVDGLFALDVVLAFFVAYREPMERGGRLVRSRAAITRRYLGGAFSVDALACIPWEPLVLLLASSLASQSVSPEAMVGDSAGVSASAAHFARLAAIARMLKLLRLTRLTRALGRRRSAEAAAATQGVASPMTVLCALLVGAHWLACAWGWIGRTEAALTMPPPPPPPLPPAVPPAVPPPSTAANEAASTTTWRARAGLETSAPVHAVYAAALHTSLAAVLRGPGEAHTAGASDVEQWSLAAMGMVGGMAWACAVAVCAAHGLQAWSSLATDEATEEGINECVTEHALPRTLALHLRTYFAASAPLKEAAAERRVLEKASARLRGDAAAAAVSPLLRGVPYLAPAQHLETDFLANVGLSLTRRLHLPHEMLRADSLTIVESGLAIRHGRLLPPCACIGDGMVVSLRALRVEDPAVVLRTTVVAVIDRPTFFAHLLADYPRAVRAVRMGALAIALRRAVVAVARQLREARSSRHADGGGGAREGAGEPMAAAPMRALWAAEAEAVATEAAADRAAADCARSAASVGSDTAGAIGSAEGFGSRAPGGRGGMSELDACGARLEAAMDALAAHAAQAALHSQVAAEPPHSRGRSGRPSSSPYRAGRTVRTRRNQHLRSGTSAPTIVVPRGEGLPPDHILEEAMRNRGVCRA